MADWLRGPLAPYVEVAIAKLPETEVLDAAAVRRVWDAHRSGRRNHEDFLWSVLMFCNWAACAR
jgi:asparagine synthase (glutamine-hydrolysing)